MGGVTVILTDLATGTTTTTTTDAAGFYLFPGLAPGSYTVTFVAPGGTELTSQDAGGNDALDSDADPVTGVTGAIALGAGVDDDSVDAGLVELASGLAILKSPDLQLVDLGADATFEITVTNTGDAPLTDVIVSDPAFPQCGFELPLLAPGQSATITCTVANVTADFTNTASATAADPAGGLVESGPDTVEVVVQGPAISVDKTPDTQAVPVGQDAPFTITVTNIGAVELVTINITDPQTPACDNVVGPLAAGASTSYDCVATGVLTDFTNTVTAVGADAEGNTVSDSDEAEVVVESGSISITKVADADAVPAGTDVTYTIVVTNAGVTNLSNVTVTDATLPACDNLFATLAAGASETYTCVAPALAEDTTNVADVVATEPDGSVVSDSATEEVIVLVPGLAITKDPNQTLIEGDTAVFTITVTNTGQVDLTDVVVTDPLTPDCDRTFAAFAVGASQTYSCSAIDVETGFVNIATVVGQSPTGPLTDEATADVIVLPTGDLVGRVFEDVNNDGVFDPLVDVPIPNVDVVLTLADGSTLTVVSGPDGTWSAVVPAGVTTIDVDESDPDFPAEFSETTTADGQTVTVANTGTTVSEPIGYIDLPGARLIGTCLLYTSPSPRDATLSRMPSSA